MRLENFLGLTGAKLRNTPAISRFDSVVFDVDKLHRGDLFVASDTTSIPVAIERGAYAILTSEPSPILDEEIAWLIAEDIEQVLLRYLRYLLVEKKIKLIALGVLELELASLCIDAKEFCFHTSLQNSIEALQSHTITHFIAPAHILEALALEAYSLDAYPITVTQEYLFETSLLFLGSYYERLPLSPLFIPALGRVASLIDRFDLAYGFTHLHRFPHFRPHFLGSDFCEVEFGKSQRVLITEPRLHLLGLEREFLLQKAPWAKKLFLCHSTSLPDFVTMPIENVRNFLYNRDFHLALCESFDVAMLAHKKREQTLL